MSWKARSGDLLTSLCTCFINPTLGIDLSLLSLPYHFDNMHVQLDQPDIYSINTRWYTCRRVASRIYLYFGRTVADYVQATHVALPVPYCLKSWIRKGNSDFKRMIFYTACTSSMSGAIPGSVIRPPCFNSHLAPIRCARVWTERVLFLTTETVLITILKSFQTHSPIRNNTQQRVVRRKELRKGIINVL